MQKPDPYRVPIWDEIFDVIWPPFNRFRKEERRFTRRLRLSVKYGLLLCAWIIAMVAVLTD